MSYETIVARILSDAATSFNLRRRIEEDRMRDPIDAMNDAEILKEIASLRLDEALNLNGVSTQSVHAAANALG
ncbi:hypothetical protein [Comamonas testosteroni]|uniref:hypothetical protein n=1 Tax=Comamonas testosteroni TaxID=285 RepID=UPI0012D2A767|nr:hypothetical protein [Comamonas testosteroni]